MITTVEGPEMSRTARPFVVWGTGSMAGGGRFIDMDRALGIPQRDSSRTMNSYRGQSGSDDLSESDDGCSPTR